MPKALGFRAESGQIHWAVVEGTPEAPIVVAHDSAAAPVNLDEAPGLSWYSNRVRLLVETYQPAAAAIRTAEPISKSNNTGATPLRIEGVLLQTLDSCNLAVTLGALATISGKLGTQAKRYIESGKCRGLDLTKIQPARREAILVAVAALPSQKG